MSKSTKPLKVNKLRSRSGFARTLVLLWIRTLIMQHVEHNSIELKLREGGGQGASSPNCDGDRKTKAIICEGARAMMGLNGSSETETDMVTLSVKGFT